MRYPSICQVHFAACQSTNSRRCQQLHIHDPIVKCKLFDALVKPILCYGCEVWSIGGNKAALAELERTEIGFLKMLLGVQTHTSTLHVLAEFGRYPLQLSWQALAEKYLNRLEKLENDRMLKQAFIADCSLPARLSWTSLLAQHGQLHGHSVSPSTDAATQRPMFSLSVARSHHVEQLSQQTSSKTSMCRSIKIGYACEPYIQQTSNRHLRRILAQFRTGSHWLNMETGRHRKQDRKDETCPIGSSTQVCPLGSLMPLILMRSAAIPLRMSTVPSLIAQLMQMPESNIVIFFRVISPPLEIF